MVHSFFSWLSETCGQLSVCSSSPQFTTSDLLDIGVERQLGGVVQSSALVRF
jgi:hypothetical protein